MSPITEAVEAWRDNKIDDTALLRAVVSHPSWRLPISEAAVVEVLSSNEPPPLYFSVDERGKNQLLLWSTPETYANWAKASNVGAVQNFIDSRGTWIFSLPIGDEVDEILLDALTPPGLYYRKEQFADLRAMAAAVSIEQDLADLRANRFSQAAVVRVREYPRYVMAVAKSSEGQRLILAPDRQNRPFAGIFTADDAARLFKPRAQAAILEGEEMIWVELPGSRVFPMLAGLPLTGVVFNCEGPVAPVAFGPTFARGVIEA